MLRKVGENRAPIVQSARIKPVQAVPLVGHTQLTFARTASPVPSVGSVRYVSCYCKVRRLQVRKAEAMTGCPVSDSVHLIIKTIASRLQERSRCLIERAQEHSLAAIKHDSHVIRPL